MTIIEKIQSLTDEQIRARIPGSQGYEKAIRGLLEQIWLNDVDKIVERDTDVVYDIHRNEILRRVIDPIEVDE